MAAATPTTHDAIIKQIYPNPDEVTRLMYENNVAFALLTKAYDGVGKNWELPLRIAHTAGRSHSFTNAKANKAGSQVVGLQINVGKNYSLYSVDGLLQRQTMNNRGAFVDAFEFELEAAMDALNRNVGYEVYGNGGGAIAQIASGQGTTTVTLLNINDIVKFEKGMILATSTTDGTTGVIKNGTVTVASVDRDLGTVTATGVWTAGILTCAASDFIFPDGDFGLGVKGFDAWIPAVAPTAGDSFFTLDRSVDPTRLAGSRVPGTGFSPEEALQKCAQVSVRNGGRIDTCFMNDLDFLNLDLSLGSRRQYVDAKTDVGVGFTGIKVATGVGSIECYADYNCKQGLAYAIDRKQWSLKGPGQFPFIESRDGGKLLREDSADAFEGRIIAYYQMQSKKVAGSVRLAW